MGEKTKQTWKQKILFYITAFFVLLGTFSLFSFLFLVPFVIDPAFTTIFMEFDETPALCVTSRTERRQGVSNCSWSSCREGCTKEIYDCTQIRVNYTKNGDVNANDTGPTLQRKKRTLPGSDDYSYEQRPFDDPAEEEYNIRDVSTEATTSEDEGLFFTDARLFPNVKGCGYPPMLNCSIFLKRYRDVGTNFSCYYSRVDPGLVISHLDMWQVYMNLVYAMAIPIPSFILSVIYLTFAYFKIYSDDEEKAPLEKNAEGMDVEGESMPDVATPLPLASGGITPASEAFREDLASFGHQLKVAMADEMSRESIADGIFNSQSG